MIYMAKIPMRLCYIHLHTRWAPLAEATHTQFLYIAICIEFKNRLHEISAN